MNHPFVTFFFFFTFVCFFSHTPKAKMNHNFQFMKRVEVGKQKRRCEERITMLQAPMTRSVTCFFFLISLFVCFTSSRQLWTPQGNEINFGRNKMRWRRDPRCFTERGRADRPTVPRSSPTLFRGETSLRAWLRSVLLGKGETNWLIYQSTGWALSFILLPNGLCVNLSFIRYSRVGGTWGRGQMDIKEGELIILSSSPIPPPSLIRV